MQWEKARYLAVVYWYIHGGRWVSRSSFASRRRHGASQTHTAYHHRSCPGASSPPFLLLTPLPITCCFWQPIRWGRKKGGLTNRPILYSGRLLFLWVTLTYKPVFFLLVPERDGCRCSPIPRCTVEGTPCSGGGRAVCVAGLSRSLLSSSCHLRYRTPPATPYGT